MTEQSFASLWGLSYSDVEYLPHQKMLWGGESSERCALNI